MSDTGNVSIQISKEIVTPIVEAKIKDAITEALGGKEALIRSVVDQVINQKVNHEGKVSTYSSDNKYTWTEWHFGETVKTLVKKELEKVINEQASTVKDEICKQLKTKKGSSTIAAAMIGAMNKTLENAWSSKIEIAFNQKD